MTAVTEPSHPENSTAAVVRKLRRERNWFTVGAVGMIAIAMAVSLPRRVQRYRAHKALNTELLDLQAQIGSLQGAIGETQKKIISVQDEIRKLQNAPR